MNSTHKKEELMHAIVAFLVAAAAFLGGCMLMYFENI